MRLGEHLPGGVEALPFGLLAAFAEEKEIQITELAECGFRFRTAEAIAVPSYFRVCFYEREPEGKMQPCYREIRLERFEMDQIANELGEYYIEYLIRTEQTGYQQAVRRLIGSYGRYIRLKLEGDDAALAEALVGYPADLDEEYCTSWEEQKRVWKKGFEYNPGFCETVKREIEVAVELDRQERYQTFLEQEPQVFFRCYCQENSLTGHWLSLQSLERIYIGNAFCPLLSPEEDVLFALMEKAYRNGLEITLTASWIRDEQLDKVERLLNKVEKWCREREKVIEIQVNDWALADMLKGRRTWLKPLLGIMLHKRRKDPRMRYLRGKKLSNQENSSGQQTHFKGKQAEKTERQSGSVKMNPDGINCQDGEYADFYQEYLQKILGIERLEDEASPMFFLNCAVVAQRNSMKHSLHLPYYQTNTSAYCPLYAQIVHGARGRQTLVRDCPQLCGQYTFLYPNHLKMVGRYNSLFGLDDRILRAEDALREYVAMGVDRIVLNFL